MDFTLKKLELFGKSTHKTKLNPNPRSASKTASNDLGVTSMILQQILGGTATGPLFFQSLSFYLLSRKLSYLKSIRFSNLYIIVRHLAIVSNLMNTNTKISKSSLNMLPFSTYRIEIEWTGAPPFNFERNGLYVGVLVTFGHSTVHGQLFWRSCSSCCCVRWDQVPWVGCKQCTQ